MLFELRDYHARPGRRDDLVRMMETEIIPFQIRLGISVVGSWTVEDEPDRFVWIRRFDSEAARERAYEAMYESDEWKADLGPRVRELLQRELMQVTRMNPTASSPLH